MSSPRCPDTPCHRSRRSPASTSVGRSTSRASRSTRVNARCFTPSSRSARTPSCSPPTAPTRRAGSRSRSKWSWAGVGSPRRCGASCSGTMPRAATRASARGHCLLSWTRFDDPERFPDHSLDITRRLPETPSPEGGMTIPRQSRRDFIRAMSQAGSLLLAGGGLVPSAHGADDPILAGRPLVRYPEKTDLILLTSRPPQLETPMKYFDRAITPNDAFFVRYHVFPVPTSVDGATWRLKVHGRVDRPLELSLDELKTTFPATKVVAVNQCSGNSRGRFSPRVLGGQWGDGAMGNAEWVGVRMRDILTRAGMRQGALQVTFDGLDKPAFPTVPDFVKSLDVTRIMNDPDVIVAYQMNGQPLPMLNGYPARLVVPGWYATYWVKNLSEIEVIDHVF